MSWHTREIAVGAVLFVVAARAVPASAVVYRCEEVPAGVFSGERYHVPGDGTFIDTTTGLQWQHWVEGGSPYLTWSNSGEDPDGGIFWWLHSQFNDGVSDAVHLDGSRGCYADRCDWRVPTAEEMWSLIDIGRSCGDSCTSIPGVIGGPAWTSTGAGYVPRYGAPPDALAVDLETGRTLVRRKAEPAELRVVRGEMGSGPSIAVRAAALAAVSAWSDLLCFLDDPTCDCFVRTAEADSDAPEFASWSARMEEIRAGCAEGAPHRSLSGMAQEAAISTCN